MSTRRSTSKVPVGDRQAPERGSSVSLLINDQRILVSPATDLRSLIAELAAAAVHGGAFVHVTGRQGNEYDILVTPTTQIVLRHDAVLLETSEIDEPWIAGVDLEY